jgi:Mn2+/Fe2+ NRAMP family transporter
MIRAFVEEALLFLLPFALFALYLVVRRKNPMAPGSWSGQMTWLVAAGLACVVAVLLATAVTAERQSGAFVPTHMENGRLVPGQFR